MTTRWTQEEATSFWNRRKWQFLMFYSGVARRNIQRLQQISDREKKQRVERNKFITTHGARAIAEATPVLNTEEASHLRFWCTNKSWTYCQLCGSLVPEKLLPSFRNGKPVAVKKTCSCARNRYVTPNDKDVPVRLLDLMEDEVRLLRPFDIHCGDYVRQRTGPF